MDIKQNANFNYNNIKQNEIQELIKLESNIPIKSLLTALIKISIENNFLPLSIEKYYQNILPSLDKLRRKDGSKYKNTSIKPVRAAIVSNNIFNKDDNKMYLLNIKEAIKYLKKLKSKPKKEIKVENKSAFLCKKKLITKKLKVDKNEKYRHGFQLLNDLLINYKKENQSKIPTLLNKSNSSIDLIEKSPNNDRIFGMLIAFKYFKPFLKRSLYSKKIDLLFKEENNLEVNKQIIETKNDLDLLQKILKKC